MSASTITPSTYPFLSTKTQQTWVNTKARTPKRQPADRHDLKVVIIMVGIIGILLMLLPVLTPLKDQLSPNTLKRAIFVGASLWGIAAMLWKRKDLDTDLL